MVGGLKTHGGCDDGNAVHRQIMRGQALCGMWNGGRRLDYGEERSREVEKDRR